MYQVYNFTDIGRNEDTLHVSAHKVNKWKVQI